MSGVAIVVFSDLVDSTALLARLGDDRMEAVRRAHVLDVRTAVGKGGGRLVKTLGDGAMASFDSALGALRAAAEIQAAVERLDLAHGEIGIAARVGVAAGEPIADGEDLHGMTVVIASRLSSAAATGEVLVQDVVGALVASRDGISLESSGEFELKGVPGAVRASQLRWRELAQQRTDGEGTWSTQPTRPRFRLPPVLAAFASEPLIGRDAEIAALREATAAADGPGAVVLTGEPGIGKTRHAAAVAAEAHADGALVVLARCPLEPAIAFEPWVRALGELACAEDGDWRGSLAATAGPELAALVPELSAEGTLADRAAADAMVAAEGARYKLLRGIAAALQFAAGEAPLMIVLDDAHWCDAASAEALGHLLADAPPGLVLVITAREREMGHGHPVSVALSDLRRTGRLDEQRLTGLDATGLAALVGARVGRAITPGLATQLLARTAGNPFFATEMACDLDGRGRLREGENLESSPAPGAVAGLVSARLDRLGTETEGLLKATAAIGPQASVSLAAAVAGLSSGQAERAVEEALSERLVDEVVAAEPTIAFPHALVREALIAATSEASAARLHLEIAGALEARGAEPAELARHYARAVALTGPERVLAAHRAAATAAAASHDHEQAADHLRKAFSLLGADDLAGRAEALLALGEQEMLSADMAAARRSFRDAAAVARRSGDAATLARAALGFAGGDIGYGWEVGIADRETADLLREGLAAIEASDPRLALRIVFRLSYLLLASGDDESLLALAERSEVLERRLGDAEAQVLARATQLMVRFCTHPEPLLVIDSFEETFDVLEVARDCGREDLLFRVVQIAAAAHYARGRIAECEQTLEWAGEIASRLGSPRFGWEVDFNRGMRLLDRGDREGAETLLRRAMAVVRRMRPDIHIAAEVLGRFLGEWIYDDRSQSSRIAYESIERATGRRQAAVPVVFSAAREGDGEFVRRRSRELMADDFEALKHPAGYLPMCVWSLAYSATLIGDREVGARLRPMLEPIRGRIISAVPAVAFGHAPEWHIGRLELLAGNPEAAVPELRQAIAIYDRCTIVWAGAMARADLARALHRLGDAEGAVAALAEAQSIGERYGIGWALAEAAEVRAEIDGHGEKAVSTAAERRRPVRALTARSGRRALSALVGRLDATELERRFADPRRQRALLTAMARGFQPSQADGFEGVIVFELEPHEIEPPADGFWRWAVEIDSAAGHARLLETAPLAAAMTLRIGMGEWVRVLAGIENALEAVAGGRATIDGDVALAIRLEGMFGG